MYIFALSSLLSFFSMYSMEQRPINEVRIINASNREISVGLYFWVWYKKPQQFSRGQQYVRFSPHSEKIVRAADLYSVGIRGKKIIPIPKVFPDVDVATLGIELDEIRLDETTIRNMSGISDTYVINSDTQKVSKE